MDQEQFQRELVYQMTLYHLRALLDRGVITRAEYEDADEALTEKYRPRYVNFARCLALETETAAAKAPRV